MPSSSWKHISTVLEKIYDFSPNSVLDIGMGFGKWGFLLREYLEVWSDRYNKSEWQVKIDGIEVFESYILETHRFLYDVIFINDVREIIAEVDSYDLIIIGDVLEHLPKQDALFVVQQCVKKAKVILINLPLGVWIQGELFDNPYEKHISVWSIGDFEHHNVKTHDVFRLKDGREFVLLEIKGENS